MAKRQTIKIERLNLDDRNSLEFFGDTSDWTGLLPVIWKIIGSDFVRIKYDEEKITATEWWTAPLHLLGVGLGWTDIGKGLRIWRELGYPETHPILVSIKKNWGSDIEALEIYLTTLVGRDFHRILSQYQHPTAHSEPEIISTFAERERRVKNFLERVGAKDTRRNACLQLVTFYDVDPLHLFSHFEQTLFGGSDSPTETGLNRFDTSSISDNGGAIIFVLARTYSQILATIQRAFDMTDQAFWDSRFIQMHVRIQKIGLTLPLQYSRKTGRWYWSELPSGKEESRHKIHLWGN